MSSSSRQINNGINHQQPVYLAEENSRIYTVMNNVPLTASNGFTQEQQIAYCNPPVNYLMSNNPQSYVYQQQVPSNQLINQFSSSDITTQQQQQLLRPSLNMPYQGVQQTMMHTNTNQQQVLVPS